MSDEYDVKICCMGAGYVGGPTMAVIAKMCPRVSFFVFGRTRRSPIKIDTLDTLLNLRKNILE